MKAVSLLVNAALPDDLKDYSQTYDAKSINRILYAVALRHPDKFAEVEKKIGDIGRHASYLNGETITIHDLAPVIDRKAIYDKMDAEIKALPKDKDFVQRRREIFQKYNEQIEKDTAKAGLEKRNNIAMSVLSGARGKNPQFKAMVSTPGTYSDYKGEPVDVFSKESFADGIRPAMFLASTNGTRASVVSAKVSTAKGGDWAKQMAAASAKQMVRESNCGTGNGISLGIEDASLKGRALAKDTGKYKAGTFLTREIIADLKGSGNENVVVRSPLTCGCKNGLCAHCIGKYFNGGKLSKVGDAVGLVASTAVSEPVTQMALCLEEHTLVRMADGSAKELKDIEPGDMVLGADKNANTFPVKVLDKFNQGVKDVRTHRFALGQTSEVLEVTATDAHKFLVRGTDGNEIRPIGELVDGDSVCMSGYTTAGRHDTTEYTEARCLDIEVDHPDHLFVLANGLITSNSAKHTAGMTQGKKTFSGLPVIQQFTQSPEKFKDRSALAEIDGVVDSVEEAPQGGMYVTVSGQKHYVLPGNEVTVKAGDTVEAGDELSDGLADAEDIIRLKGLGAGRKYYADRLGKILADSGAASDPRNIEIIARGAVNHVRITGNDSVGNYLPDDVIDYNALQASYKAPETARAMNTKQSVGKYLQSPALHYSIGTRITPKVAAELDKNGYSSIVVDDNKPEFEPEMVRLRSADHNNRDWLASQSTSYLTQQLEESVTRGDDTNVLENDDYRPRIAYGRGFGSNVETTGKF